MTGKPANLSRDIRLEVILKEYLNLAQGAGSKVEKLTNAFIKSIEAGYWRPGDRIPTEVLLTEALPLSLGTIQTVLRRLTDEGIIERRRGTGSRIADLSDRGRDVWFLRFLNKDTGQRVGVKVVSFDIAETDEQGPWSLFLAQGSGCIRIDRTFLVAGRLRVIGRLYLEMEVFCRTFRDEPLFYQKFSIPPSRRWINIRTPES
jgi:DNA-binding GntR family transcriptional regulator